MDLMTERQTLLVKNSWALFRRIDPQLIGDVFYSRLFQQMPALKSMFKTNMAEQYAKLVDMLSYIVSKLDKPEQFAGDVEQLAQRHVQYGVRPGHYKVVGDALLWTLEKGLGKDWNAEVGEAWAACYGMLSSLMIGKRQ
ncbi:globin domain-containing protein [Sediminibacterium roseum]|nr:globin domain-containing protein [Sediminibacterium roseum]